MSAVIFRKIVRSDFLNILSLNKDFVPRVGPITEDWLEKYFNEAAHFEVAVNENQLVGFFIAMLPDTDYKSENFLWFKNYSKSFIYVDRLAINSNFQGQGIGKKFYQRLFDAYSGIVNEVTCEVNLRPENPQSLNFHKSVGFVEVGQQETKGGEIRVSLLARRI